MRERLTKEQIKAIADRAEGKEPEHVLRTFICKECKHEVVVKPTTPKYETPTMCGQCWEKQRESELHEQKRREVPMNPEQALKMLTLGGEILGTLRDMEKMEAAKKEKRKKKK